MTVAAALPLGGEEFFLAARLVLGAHIPVMVTEGAITAAAVSFLWKVRPELLQARGSPAA